MERISVIIYLWSCEKIFPYFGKYFAHANKIYFLEVIPMAKKYCYLFSEGNADMRELLGGKGANLAEMTNIGLPVPQGFTITTEACTQYYRTEERSMMRFLLRSMSTSAKWKVSQERNSATKRILFSFPFVQAQELQCPV